MLKHKMFGLGFGLICCLALTTLGFSTWIAGNNQSNDSGDIDAGVGGLENQDTITFNGSNVSLIQITKDGLVYDSTYVPTVTLTYNFSLINAKFGSISSVTYTTTLVMSNVAENFKYNLDSCGLNDALTAFDLAKLPKYANRSYTYTSDFTVKLDKSSQTGQTNFRISYKFKSDTVNSIYDNLAGRLNLKLTLLQK